MFSHGWLVVPGRVCQVAHVPWRHSCSLTHTSVPHMSQYTKIMMINYYGGSNDDYGEQEKPIHGVSMRSSMLKVESKLLNF